MKKIFKLSNLIPLLLVVYIAKSFIVGSSFFDFGIITLMSMSFLYKLKLDKDVYTDKEELKTIISHVEENVNKKMSDISRAHYEREEILQKEFDEKLLELQKIQDNDRLAAENKFSTLNLGMQRQPKPAQERETYGWGNIRK